MHCAKALVTLVPTFAIIVESIVAHDNKILPDDPYDWIVIATSFTSMFAVYFVPNKPPIKDAS